MHPTICRCAADVAANPLKRQAAVLSFELHPAVDVANRDSAIVRFNGQVGSARNKNLVADRPIKILPVVRAFCTNFQAAGLDPNFLCQLFRFGFRRCRGLHLRPHQNIVAVPSFHRNAAIPSSVDIYRTPRRHGLFPDLAIALQLPFIPNHLAFAALHRAVLLLG